jgi:hypothetical protein
MRRGRCTAARSVICCIVRCVACLVACSGSLSLLLWGTGAQALEALRLTRADAEQAAGVIKASGEVRRYCADCGEKPGAPEKVGKVELKAAGAHWVILLNGKSADPAAIYFREGKSWRNLAIRQSLLQAGVPETLDAADAGPDCAQLADGARKREVRLNPPSAYVVAGTGRLPFHLAPDAACRDKNIFVIPGDRLTAYSEYQGYTSVMYLNPKTGQDFSGWVESKRLQFAGTVAPAQ